MRSALAIAAGLLCAMAGMRAAAALRQEARDLRRWADLLAHLTLIIRQATLPLPAAMLASADAALAPDKYLRATAEHLSAHPLTTPQEAFSAACPVCAGYEALQRMFARLGRGDAESMALACHQASAELDLLASHAEKRAATDARLWRTLGWTAGACMTILLL